MTAHGVCYRRRSRPRRSRMPVRPQLVKVASSVARRVLGQLVRHEDQKLPKRRAVLVGQVKRATRRWVKEVSQMSCQPIILTENQMSEMSNHVRRIEKAKTLVCGVPSVEALADLRRGVENIFPLLEKSYRLLNSGVLDKFSDEELRVCAAGMRERDAIMTDIYEGSLRIGLEGIEPFPKLLAEFKAHQEKAQSQLEGILLSLSESFRDLLEKSA